MFDTKIVWAVLIGRILYSQTNKLTNKNIHHYDNIYHPTHSPLNQDGHMAYISQEDSLKAVDTNW